MNVVALKDTLEEIGLGPPRRSGAKAAQADPPAPFHRDGRFIIALLLGAFFCIVWRVGFAEMESGPAPFGALVVFSLVLWQPFVEEVLFRGIIQGFLLKNRLGSRKLAGISGANIGATALFTIGHFVMHSPAWAVSVVIPSLIFGYFRERHRSAYPAITLHIAYNAFYFVTLSRYAPL